MQVNIKKMFLVCTVITMLIFPTAQVKATENVKSELDEAIVVQGRNIQQMVIGEYRINYNTNNHAVTIVSYLGSQKALTIPPNFIINGRYCPVVAIGNDAFDNRGLTSVVLPHGLVTIGISAFRRNQLTSVVIPSSVTTIELAAFYWNQLRSVEIPNSVTYIGMAAFQANELTSVEIPNSVTTLGAEAFSMNKLRSVKISNSITTLEDSVFMMNQLTSVEIPNSVTTIGKTVFFENQITSIYIPTSVRYIDWGFLYDNPTQAIYTDDGNADRLRNILNADAMDRVAANQTRLGESASHYTNLESTENTVAVGASLSFNAIPQMKYAYNNTQGWVTHVPIVQWYYNRNPILGENRFQFNLFNIQMEDAGVYYAMIDSVKLEDITVHVAPLYSISEIFDDENLAKAIAEHLYGNPNINQLVSLAELASIEILNLEGKNIQDLTGIEHLVGLWSLNLNNNRIHDVGPLVEMNSLQFLNLNRNQISDISMFSTITNLFTLTVEDQMITLPEGVRGEPTDLQLVNRDGSTPNVTFVKGQGTYTDGKLTWNTSGENQLTWSGSQFSGTITQTVMDKQYPINTFFPDENLAKGIAQQLNSNNDISALTTETELATITILNIPNMGIKDLAGLDHLKNLVMINAVENHIHDIRIISKLPNIVIYSFLNQTIQLPEGVRGEPTNVQLVGRDGSTPLITFVKGQGTYENGKLTWNTGGENQLTWQEGFNFSGTLTQNVKNNGLPISNFFPDENLAKEIALSLNNNQDISAITTEEELSKISILNIPQKGIKDLTGIDHLKNLSIISASGNHIHDIRILSKLPNILYYNFTNQTIPLPEGVLGEATDLPIVNINGSTPSVTFVKGQGTYANGKLTWNTVGNNQLTWQDPQFSGTVTQTTIPPIGQSIASIFPDENLAKEIAQILHGNQDTSAIVTDQELLTIPTLNIPEHGIKDLSGIERLTNLIALNATNNHIQDISMLSHLPNLLVFMLDTQVITLPAGTVGTPTSLTLLNKQGMVPNHTFSVGQGTYDNGELIWTTTGENQLTWADNSSGLGGFNGTVIQNVVQPNQTIASMFPDANFAK